MRDILIAALLVGALWLTLAGWSHKNHETLPHDAVLAPADVVPGATATYTGAWQPSVVGSTGSGFLLSSGCPQAGVCSMEVDVNNYRSR